MPSIDGRQRRRLLAWAVATAASVGAASLAGCRRGPAAAMADALPAGSRVLAIGDSLTHGTGAAPDDAYPAVLARLTGWQVANAGVPGEVAAQVQARLPSLLTELAPALVILGAGGNDWLRGGPEAAVEAALAQSIAQARAAGAGVVLVAVPRPTLAARLGVGLDDHPLYERVAAQSGAWLHAGGWSRVLGDASLRADAIHANAAGYRAFAEGLAARLRELGLLR